MSNANDQRVCVVEILKVEAADSFWVKLVDSQADEEFEKQRHLLNNASLQSVQNLQEGTIYLFFNEMDQSMHRAKCCHVLFSKHGLKAECWLVDKAEYVTVLQSKLKIAPAKFANLPVHVVRFKLYGLQPLRLDHNNDLQMGFTPAINYSEFANNYVREKFPINSWCTVEVSIMDKAEGLFGRIFIPDSKQCLNDILVQMNLAKVIPVTSDEVFNQFKHKKHNDDSSSSNHLFQKDEISSKNLYPMQQTTMPILSFTGASSENASPVLPSAVNEMKGHQFPSTSPIYNLSSMPNVCGLGRGKKISTQSKSLPASASKSDQGAPSHLSNREAGILKSDDLPAPGFLPELMIPCANISDERLSRLPKHITINHKNKAAESFVASDNLFDIKQPFTDSRQTALSNDSSFLHSKQTVLSKKTYKYSEVVGGGLNENMLKQIGSEDSIIRLFLKNKLGDVTDVESNEKQSVNPSKSYGVMLHYPMQSLMPITSVLDTSFSDIIRKCIASEDIQLTSLQMYAWAPACIPRGHNFVGIAQRKMGKTFTHLAYLASTLRSVSTENFNLLVVVVCPNIRTAEDVYEKYDKCMKLVNNKCVVKLLHSGPELHKPSGTWRDMEETVQFSILNGCNVLVATVSSLLRILNKKILLLNQLKYFVYEDADVLAEKFDDEINQLQAKLADKSVLPITPQQLIFACYWTPNLEVFINKYLKKNFILIIASKCEAAVFANIKETPVVCTADKCLEKVLEYAVQSQQVQQKIIIFTSDDQAVLRISKDLESASVPVIELTCQTSNIGAVLHKWEQLSLMKSSPILVTSDMVLVNEKLHIYDATIVIHFDLPKTAKTYGNRVWCMSDNFVNRFSSAQKSQCESVWLVSNQFDRLRFIVSFLKRSLSNSVLNELLQLVVECEKRAALSGSVALCRQMKELGKCVNQDRCRLRHDIYESLDLPGNDSHYVTLPCEGKIKVRVMSMISASSFYCRLLTYTDLSGKIVSYQEQFTNLLSRLTSLRQSLRSPKSYEPGGLYLLQDKTNLTIHRVKVTDDFERNYIPKILNVICVDTGKKFEVDPISLMEFDASCQNIPFQAVEVIMCRVQPLDKDNEWTPKLESYVKERLLNKEVEGNIILSLSNTLWLDPLLLKETVGENTVHQCIRTHLVRDCKYMEENTEHLPLLYKLCDNKMRINGLLSHHWTRLRAFTYHGEIVLPKVSSIKDNVLMVPVRMTAVESPQLVYLQLEESRKALEELHNEIYQYVNLSSRSISTCQLQCGTLILAQNPTKWMRGKIHSIQADDDERMEIDVFFVDTGESEYKMYADIKPLEAQRFLRLPFQAIECSLAHVAPVDGECWSEQVVELLLSYLERPLFTTIVSKCDARYQGNLQYSVNLYSYEEDGSLTVLNDLIVRKGLARPTREFLQSIFEEAYKPRENSSSSVLSCLCELCVVIIEYQMTDCDKAMSAALELHEQIAIYRDLDNSEENVTALCEKFARLLSWLGVDSLLEKVLHSISVILANRSFCAVVASNLPFITVLSQLLYQNYEVSTVYALVDVLHTLSDHACCCQVLIDRGTADMLGKLLLRAELNEEFLKLSSDLLLKLLQQWHDELNENDCENDAFGLQCVEGIVHGLSLPNENILLNCLRCIQFLLPYNGTYSLLKKLNFVQHICSVFVMYSSSDNCNLITKLCLNLLCDITKSKKESHHLIKNVQFTDTLFRFFRENNCMKDSKTLCEKLFLRLQQCGLNLPSSVYVKEYCPNNQPLPNQLVQSAVVQLRKRPEIRWSQSRWNVFLFVEVPGVRKHLNPVDFTESTLSFGAVVEAVEYFFTLQLYENIVPKMCEVKVLCSEVIIGLKKLTPGLWQRVTKERNKQFVKPDFVYYFEDDDFASSSDQEKESSEQNDSPLALLSRHQSTCAHTPNDTSKPNINHSADLYTNMWEDDDSTSDNNSDELFDDTLQFHD